MTDLPRYHWFGVKSWNSPAFDGDWVKWTDVSSRLQQLERLLAALDETDVEDAIAQIEFDVKRSVDVANEIKQLSAAAPDAGAPQESARTTTTEKNLAELIKAEAAYRENEQHMLRKLSRILSDGNASTWDEIVHAAEQLAPAAHQETPEPTCRCGHVLESHLNAAAMQHCRECACRAFEEAAPARAAEWQPQLLQTVMVESEWKRALDWRERFLNSEDDGELAGLSHQTVCYLVADCMTFRELVEKVEKLLPPCALTGNSNSKT